MVQPTKWLPRIGYTFDFVHQFGAFLPKNGDFRDESQVPNQFTYLQNLNADWSLSDKTRLGFRHSRSFQDNRQKGREKADFRNNSDAFSFGYSGIKNVELNFDLSHESAANLEQPRTDNTFRFGTSITWREAILKNLTFNTNFSSILAADRAHTFNSQNIEYDAQLAYNFTLGKEKFKKLSTQLFVRYANRYGNRFDRLLLLNAFNKNQGFNMGLNLNVF